MAEESGDKKEGKRTERLTSIKPDEVFKNSTTFDNIQKEINICERKSRNNWSKKYAHFTGEYLHKVLAEECRKAGLPVDTFKRPPPEDPIEHSPIRLRPSPAIPRTTSAMVGWRSSHEDYNLEFTGQWYISPKWTIEPPIEPGGFRVTHQNFIFLG